MTSRFLPQNSELLVSIFVIAIALLLLVPLPTIVLDLLLVINLATAFFLLLVVLYLPDSVRLLAFPTLLLLTTLFRLGLNVASTRLILSQGYAGEVIEAFGTFLVGGELLVGIVVFAIITVINLIVIAKGAGRISEVAARFALDSLPGKQMSIDADLRAGLISPQEAEKRREQLRKESQLYGAMDGAMKFVQGDAVAGIVIIFTNVIGGLTLGVMNGMPLQEAITTYTVLTVGDGLVSQIPAFLIAICAGLVVTRISASQHTTLGSDLKDQLFEQPAVLIVVSVLLALLAWIDGMPKVPFLIIAAGTFLLWFFFRGYVFSPQGVKGDITPRLNLSGRKRTSQHLLPQNALTLALDESALLPAYVRHEEDLNRRWLNLAEEARFYFGFPLPTPQISGDPTLGRGHYELRKGQQVLAHYHIPGNAVYVSLHPRQARLLGYDVVSEEQDPILGGTGTWTPSHRAVQLSEALRVPVFTWLEFIELQLFEYCRRNPAEVVSMSMLHAQLKDLENIQPGLVSQTFDRYGMNVSRLTNVVHQLLREGLPFMGLHQMIEHISTYYTAIVPTQDASEEFDISDLVSFIRLQNRHRLLGAAAVSDKTFRVIRLSPEVERLMLQADSRLLGGGQTLGRETYAQLRNGLETLLSGLRQKGVLPVSVECPEILRVPIYHFLQTLPFAVPFICEEEIELHVPRTVIGEWRVAGE